MNDAVIADTELLSFADDSTVKEVVDAMKRLAVSLESHDESDRGTPEELNAAAQQLRETQIVDLLTAADHPFSPQSMLFHLADLLGGSNVTVAWQGLSGVPAAVALTLSRPDANSGEHALAFPVAEQPAAWSLLQPLPPPDESAAYWIIERSDLHLLAERPTAGPKAGLLGFPHGRVTSVNHVDQQPGAVFALDAREHQLLLRTWHALFAGLLNGALRRMVTEAYAYAKTRKSAGKPINQHQAVALRLADLALYQQGVAVYLKAAVEQAGFVGCQEGVHEINSDFVAECVARVTEGAVQVAAAHGYVEGLPFKRLFEQSRTLASCLALIAACSRNAGRRRH